MESWIMGRRCLDSTMKHNVAMLEVGFWVFLELFFTLVFFIFLACIRYFQRSVVLQIWQLYLQNVELELIWAKSVNYDCMYKFSWIRERRCHYFWWKRVQCLFSKVGQGAFNSSSQECLAIEPICLWHCFCEIEFVLRNCFLRNRWFFQQS